MFRDHQPITLGEPERSALEKVKVKLAETVLLVHPKSDALLHLMTDSSDVGVGGVLQQLADGEWQPLSLFTKRL